MGDALSESQQQKQTIDKRFQLWVYSTHTRLPLQSQKCDKVKQIWKTSEIANQHYQIVRRMISTWSPVDDRANLKILMMRAIRKTWKRLNKFISSDCLSHRVDAFWWQKLTWMILDISSKFVPSSSRIVIGVVISLSIGCSVTSRGKRLSCRNVQRKNQMEF